MSSSVYFKFKSQKEPTRVEFDGTGISVFELKRDIIIKSGLGDGTDFDLAIYTEDGKEGKCSCPHIIYIMSKVF
jgi:protein MPE1